jgi:hypothetical protein
LLCLWNNGELKDNHGYSMGWNVFHPRMASRIVVNKT